jgi:hypothetical protein
MPRIGPLWRVFPWDSRAEDGAPFSARFVPGGQGSGRFDLAAGPVLYLAEDPQHAVAEKIQRLRGLSLEAFDLLEYGNPLALVRVVLPDEVADGLLDLCDPAALVTHSIRPDEVAARSGNTTRAIAAEIHARGFHGLRWWSAFRGEWHTITLFLDRSPVDALDFSVPEALTVQHPAVVKAAEALMIRIR